MSTNSKEQKGPTCNFCGKRLIIEDPYFHCSDPDHGNVLISESLLRKKPAPVCGRSKELAEA